MWNRIKNFFNKAWVQWGLTLAAIGGAVAYFFKVNDLSRPPAPDPEKPHDFTGDIEKIDPKRPVGIFIFNHATGESLGTKLTVNTTRNNLIEKMQQHYGENMVVIDNPSTLHFDNFSKQFNGRFASSKPAVHFVANHHTKHPLNEDTYNKKVADFIASIQSDKKRALILSCGPESKTYKNTGCEYVVIPRPDGEVLGRAFDLEYSPAYKDAIGWMAENKDPEAIRKKFNESSIGNCLQGISDRLHTLAKDIYLGEPIEPHKPPMILVPPAVIPPKPKSGQSKGAAK